MEMSERITELAQKQDQEIRRQRDNVERLRSIFGRLQTFAQQGWFLLGEEGQQDRWLRADAVMEILTAAEMIIDGPNTSGNRSTAPFGIHPMGDVSDRSDGRGNGPIGSSYTHPLDS